MITSKRKQKYRGLIAKLVIAILVAFLLVLLGQFEGLGFNVHNVHELSFVPDYNRGYANATFRLEATYNPLLYPFYWIAGRGYVSGSFSMIYLPHSYFPGDFGGPNYGQSPEDRYQNYISSATNWGILPNIVVLIFLTIVVEGMGHRVLYILLLFGILGFSIAGIFGTVAALMIGAIITIYILRRGFALPLAGLRGYIFRRIVYSFALVVLVITLDFIIFMRLPGSTVDLFDSPEQQAQWGVTQALIPQYLTYLRNLLSWNLGKTGKALVLSMKGEIIPVVQGLAQKLPYTILVLSGATIISILFGIYLGVLAVRRRGRVAEGMTVFSLMVSSLPVWWIGSLMVFYLGYVLGWFPTEGGYPIKEWAVNPPVVYNVHLLYSPNGILMNVHISFQEFLRLAGGYLHYAFLPICAQALSMIGIWIVLTRASLLGVIGEDYLVTARAKGVKEWKILTKHALPNAILPLVTSAALSFGFIITGSVLVETVFRYPGLGVWLYEAIWNSDYPVLMTMFYVIALCVIIANIIADFLYGLLDPRIKTG